MASFIYLKEIMNFLQQLPLLAVSNTSNASMY